MLEHLGARALDLSYPCSLEYLKALEEDGVESLKHRCEAKCQLFFKQMCEPDHKSYYLIPEERTGPKLCHKK